MNLTYSVRVEAAICIAPEAAASGGLAEHPWSSEQSSDVAWAVNWYERGNKSGQVRLPDQTVACFQLLERLSDGQLPANAIGEGNRC